jgi:hypothetical protein
MVHIGHWKEGLWLGLDDTSLLISCAEENLILATFDRATLAWKAGELLRAGKDHAGVILFRGLVRSSDYGRQGRLLTRFWQEGADGWDWQNRIVYLPKSP